MTPGKRVRLARKEKRGGVEATFLKLQCSVFSDRTPGTEQQPVYMPVTQLRQAEKPPSEKRSRAVTEGFHQRKHPDSSESSAPFWLLRQEKFSRLLCSCFQNQTGSASLPLSLQASQQLATLVRPPAVALGSPEVADCLVFAVHLSSNGSPLRFPTRAL